jgi:hypothetical protein
MRGLLAALAAGTIVGACSLEAQENKATAPPTLEAPAPAIEPVLPEAAFDQAAALEALRERIRGRENEPSSAVFEQVSVLKAMPAGRLLKIMEMGFSRSLGVSCTHCHVPERWESDEKAPKNTARDMWRMVEELNVDLLPAIRGLEDRRPTVNCTTCHRGEAKPALSLPPT